MSASHRSPRVPSAIEALLEGARFESIYADWLEPRERMLASHFRSLPVVRDTNVLLLNATKGPQLFPSIVDFFALLQKTQPRVRVTSASYFDEIFELSRGAARKGLHVVPIRDVESWPVATLNRFDVVLAVGPSVALARLIALRGLRCRLVCLDLAFYHQLIEASGGGFLRDEKVVSGVEPSRANPVVCYSCQPEAKIRTDLARAGFVLSERRRWWQKGIGANRTSWSFRWFGYIPLGLAYQPYYACDRVAFDVALLGTSGRSYGHIDPAVLRGRRVLFIGRAENEPELERLRAEVPITMVSGLDEDTYARLLALCRCVVLPTKSPGHNVFMSVVDALASGKPLVTARLPGLARLEREGAPMELYDGLPEAWHARSINRARLAAALERVLGDEERRRRMGDRAIAFAKERLDIHHVLEAILEEQVLGAARVG